MGKKATSQHNQSTGQKTFFEGKYPQSQRSIHNPSSPSSFNTSDLDKVSRCSKSLPFFYRTEKRLKKLQQRNHIQRRVMEFSTNPIKDESEEYIKSESSGIEEEILNRCCQESVEIVVKKELKSDSLSERNCCFEENQNQPQIKVKSELKEENGRSSQSLVSLENRLNHRLNTSIITILSRIIGMEDQLRQISHNLQEMRGRDDCIEQRYVKDEIMHQITKFELVRQGLIKDEQMEPIKKEIKKENERW